jgi:LTXXQ motif family protein
MRRTIITLTLVAGMTSAALAQQPTSPPPSQGGPGRTFQAPPDHWSTIDSLVQALGITAQQRPAFTQHYNAINSIMREAAQVRDSMRQAMQAGAPAAGERPSQEAMQAVRARFEPMQAELQTHLDALKSGLTPEQVTKLGALPQPAVMRRRPPPSQTPPPSQN